MTQFLDSLATSVIIVLPVVAMLVIGRIYARAKGFSLELTRGIGSLVFWVCLPALTFKEVVRADLHAVIEPRLCLGIFLAFVACVILGYRYARLRGAKENQVGVIAQGAMRSNMLYIGFPVLMFYAQARAAGRAPADAHDIRERIIQTTAFAAAFSIPMVNALSIIGFELPGRKTAKHKLSVFTLTIRILLNPMVIAVLLAIFVQSALGTQSWFEPSTVPGKVVDLAAAAALPTVLFAIGANLDLKRACIGWRETLPVAAIKLLLMPALGLGLLWLLGLRGDVLVIGIVMLACPDAATGHAMAAEYDADEELAGELVAVTTLLCPFTLVVWLSILSLIA